MMPLKSDFLMLDIFHLSHCRQSPYLYAFSKEGNAHLRLPIACDGQHAIQPLFLHPPALAPSLPPHAIDRIASHHRNTQPARTHARTPHRRNRCTDGKHNARDVTQTHALDSVVFMWQSCNQARASLPFYITTRKTPPSSCFQLPPSPLLSLSPPPLFPLPSLRGSGGIPGEAHVSFSRGHG